MNEHKRIRMSEAVSRLVHFGNNPDLGLEPSTHVRETFRDTITALATGAQTPDDVNYARLLYVIAGWFTGENPVSPYRECEACLSAALARIEGPPAEPKLNAWFIENRHRESRDRSWTPISSGLTKEEAWARLCRNRTEGHKSYEYRMVAVY